MEKIVKKVETLNKDLVIAKYRLFEWKNTEEHIGFLFSKITFERDDSVPHHQELKKLEDEYGGIKNMPFVIILVLALIAILIVTGLLVLFAANRDLAKQYWIAFILPAGVCLVGAMICTFLKLRFFDQMVKELPDKNKKYAQKVQEIKK